MVPVFGVLTFSRKTALKPGFLYGGEIAHHFRVRHPFLTWGLFFSAIGSHTELLEDDRRVDVIVATLGTSLMFRTPINLNPTVHAGSHAPVIGRSSSPQAATKPTIMARVTAMLIFCTVLRPLIALRPRVCIWLKNATMRSTQSSLCQSAEVIPASS